MSKYIYEKYTKSYYYTSWSSERVTENLAGEVSLYSNDRVCVRAEWNGSYYEEAQAYYDINGSMNSGYGKKLSTYANGLFDRHRRMYIVENSEYMCTWLYIEWERKEGYAYIANRVKKGERTRSKRDTKGSYIEDIIAEDGTYPDNGPSGSYWYVKKGPANKAPSVSGKDQDLGDISAAINYKYTVFDEDNDTLSVVERLNNEVIEVRNNVKSGSEFTATIAKEKIYSLELGKKNTLQIEVSDGTERVYRNITFTRINTAPIIQVLSSKDLGEIIEPFDTTIKVTDIENDSVGIVYKTILVEKVNNNIKKTLMYKDEIDNIKLNSELKYSIPQNIFSLLLNGDYELEITATDSQGGESKEVVKFTRTEDTIDYSSKVIETEVMAKQIMIMPTISGTPKNVKIMACNNAFDKVKAWEDVTNEALNMLPYNFKNTSKTAAKWGIQAQFILNGKGAK